MLDIKKISQNERLSQKGKLLLYHLIDYGTKKKRYSSITLSLLMYGLLLFTLYRGVDLVRVALLSMLSVVFIARFFLCLLAARLISLLHEIDENKEFISQSGNSCWDDVENELE